MHTRARFIAVGLGMWSGCATDADSTAQGVALADCTELVSGYLDGDGDGFGAEGPFILRCGAVPPGFAERGGDCDDFRADTSPAGQEVCGDGWDQDCDGVDLACPELALVWTIPGESGEGLGHALAASVDVTGDGVGDLVATGTKAGGGSGVVEVLGGPAHPIDGVASAAAISGPLGGLYGTDVLAPGDLGGDGVADIVWGAPGDGMLGDGAGRVWVGWGPFVGDRDAGHGSGLISGDNGVWGLGESLAAGDLTGDGVVDLVMGAPAGGAWDTYEGRAMVVPFPLPTDHVPSVGTDAFVWDGVGVADGFGTRVAVVADRNGDGMAELAVSAPGAGGSEGVVYLWYGPVTDGGLAEDADLIEGGSGPGVGFGTALTSADFDSDGYAELLVGSPGAGGGMVERIHPDGDRDLLGSTTPTSLGVAMDAADLDGDGWLDLVVGAPTAADQDGAVGIWWGPLSGSTDWDDLDDRFEGSETASALGTSVVVHPDWTGDGLPDIVAGAPESGSGDGALWVFSGALWTADGE